MIFRLAPHPPTENTDDVTGQSFTDKGSGVSCQKVVYINLLKCEYFKFLGTSPKKSERDRV
jgi:hypothetical protein